MFCFNMSGFGIFQDKIVTINCGTRHSDIFNRNEQVTAWLISFRKFQHRYFFICKAGSVLQRCKEYRVLRQGMFRWDQEGGRTLEQAS